MIARPRWHALGGVLLTAAAALGCADVPTQAPPRPGTPQLGAVQFWNITASTRWIERALGLVALQPPGNAQAAVSRILTYVSLAQYRAVLAAEAGKDGRVHPSVAAAVGSASAAVLTGFFPGHAATVEAHLDADLAAEQWPGARHQDAASGEAIGRAVGATILAQAAGDNYLVVPTGTPPVGTGLWVSSGAPIVRSLHGARPFFLTSASQLRPPPPPTFGSPAFLAALAEVRSIADNRTPAQLATALFWNTSSAPFTAGALNLIAVELIRAHHRTEREAARTLAYANAAAFDAQIACWDAKVAYWFIRPSQADPGISLAIGLPNHPSYPSGHSCITGALMTVLMDAFPSERARLAGIIELAGVSRVYGGIHYRFDIEAGRLIGERAAALAVAGSLE